MEVIEKTVEYTRADSIYTIYPIGDTHLGTKHCTESDLQKTITEIKENPFALWIGIGDYGEFITPDDKRWDVASIADWLKLDSKGNPDDAWQDNITEEQTGHICKLFEPIKDKCIGLLEGNHESAIRRFLHVNVQKNICDRLELPNLGYSCWVKLRFARENSNERHVYKCVFTHGEGWAITPGAKMNRLQRFMNSFDARIYGMGHMHDIITHTVPYLELSDSNLIRQRERVGAVTGCWFKTYSQGLASSYGEVEGFPPTSLGCPKYVLDLNRDIVKVEG
jgi:hypothetical protein